ncbi:nuclear transport factor 2 family protein [Candidatus Poribacteria bacterium]|jgi:hypothetical protein|nr:nuclear transport factor 2 family protein [Candidatus Poribacteria bacterium]MBT5709984.1 nuclear transport factor 2 family protein [Candidatus Poribacteria bacterium]MBT7098971.1 nuclear transport factor 2 family protein [Candidatus Poribacteria bacterium]MBT7808075.1 nuclear transport factor 2 family protein [Candidatus Poribacteria bacterium]
MRRWLYALALALVVVTSAARADPLFDRGVALAALASQLVHAENSADPDAAVDLFAEHNDIAYYEGADEHVGRDATLAALTARLAGLPKGALVATAPRILVEAAIGWIVVEWEWDGATGRHIARARRDGGVWRLDALDFDGDSADGPVGAFDASSATDALDGPVGMMENGAAAFAEGDQEAIESLIVEEQDDFLFITEDGVRWPGIDGILMAGFTAALGGVPDGISREEMTLFVGAGLGRAIAFQEIDGKRVSLQLERRDRWRIVEASLSSPLDVLPVSPVGAVATTWANLRRSAR